MKDQRTGIRLRIALTIILVLRSVKITLYKVVPFPKRAQLSNPSIVSFSNIASQSTVAREDVEI